MPRTLVRIAFGVGVFGAAVALVVHLLTVASVPVPGGMRAVLPGLFVALFPGLFVACTPAIWWTWRGGSPAVGRASLPTWQRWGLGLVTVYALGTVVVAGLGGEGGEGLRSASAILLSFHVGGAALSRQVLAALRT